MTQTLFSALLTMSGPDGKNACHVLLTFLLLVVQSQYCCFQSLEILEMKEMGSALFAPV